MTSKTCTKCKIEKDITLFSTATRHKDGKTSRCTECTREDGRKWQREHRDPEKDRIQSRLWRKNNPDKVKEYNIRWRRESPDVLRNATARWRIKNSVKVRADLIKWHKENPGKHSEYNKKRRSTPKGKLNASISIAICNSLKSNKNGWHWEDLVGYTLKQLKKHLEKQFVGGMSWDNYGKKGWEIDHRIPQSAFNFETPFDLDFRQCWALRNLQPLWVAKNRSKKDKLERPHQPSLLI